MPKHIHFFKIQSPTDLAVSLLANRFLQCHDGGEPFIIWTTISYQADTPKGTLPGESGNRSKNAVGISKQWLVENGIMDDDISPYQCRYQNIYIYIISLPLCLSIYLSIHPSIHLSICLYVYLSTYLISIFLSICLSTYLSMYICFLYSYFYLPKKIL